MSGYIKGGRGKKAPYQTVHYRIPEPIKPTVEILAEQYRQLIVAQSLTEAEELLEWIRLTITNSQAVSKKPGTKFNTKFNENDLEQVVSILQDALKLKANAGGAIKQCIREAINLLESKSN